MFCNTIGFYGEELLAPHQTPKLEDNPLSAVRNCLFNIFAATLHIGGHSFIHNLRTGHVMATGTHVSRKQATLIFITYFLMKDCQCINSHYSVLWFRRQAVWFVIDFVAVDSRIARAISAGYLKLSFVKCLLLCLWVAQQVSVLTFQRYLLRNVGTLIYNLLRNPTADRQLNNNSCKSLEAFINNGCSNTNH